MMNQLQIASRIDLVCPICHVDGECEAHCVEAWQQGNRRDHLRNLLTPYPNIAPQLLQATCTASSLTFGMTVSEHKTSLLCAGTMCAKADKVTVCLQVG